MQRKRIDGGHVTKAYDYQKQTEGEQPVMVGVVAGYLSTWDTDRIGDQFVKGAFAETIKELQERQRPLRLKRNHANLIGGFNPDTLKEDDIGLYGEAEINLYVQEGREAYNLAKQGVLSDFSVGFSVDQSDIDMVEGVRKFKKAKLWETSLVDEPMNPKAVATMIRSAMPVTQLPNDLASRDIDWDGEKAEANIRRYTGSDEAPSDTYKNFYLWYDDADPDSFESYKMPIADVIDGTPMVVPRAVFAVRAALEGARGGVDIPEDEREAVQKTVNALYEKMDMEPPFDKGLVLWTSEELRGLRVSQRSDIIKSGNITKSAAKELANLYNPAKGYRAPDSTGEVLRMLRKAAGIKQVDQDAVAEVRGALEEKSNAVDAMRDVIGSDTFNEDTIAEFLGLLEADTRRNDTIKDLLAISGEMGGGSTDDEDIKSIINLIRSAQ